MLLVGVRRAEEGGKWYGWWVYREGVDIGTPRSATDREQVVSHNRGRWFSLSRQLDHSHMIMNEQECLCIMQ